MKKADRGSRLRRQDAAKRNRERIRALFRAIDSSDWQALPVCFDASVVYERPGYDPISGRERVLHFYRYERMVASGVHEVDGIVVDGDLGVCWGRLRGKLKSGAPADVQFADVFSFVGGRIRTRRSYFFKPAV